jgi:hypothetical protein
LEIAPVWDQPEAVHAGDLLDFLGLYNSHADGGSKHAISNPESSSASGFRNFRFKRAAI